LTVYLDTSVLLRWLLNSKDKSDDFFKWETCISSELIAIETNRVLNRLRLENQISDKDFALLHQTFQEFYDSLSVIEINKAVKKRAAEPFPTILGTLDAIHLSSAILWQEIYPDVELKIFTHDTQLATAAIAVGLKTRGL